MGLLLIVYRLVFLILALLLIYVIVCPKSAKWNRFFGKLKIMLIPCMLVILVNMLSPF